jgi:hypothetical protein
MARRPGSRSPASRRNVYINARGRTGRIWLWGNLAAPRHTSPRKEPSGANFGAVNVRLSGTLTPSAPCFACYNSFPREVWRVRRNGRGRRFLLCLMEIGLVVVLVSGRVVSNGMGPLSGRRAADPRRAVNGRVGARPAHSLTLARTHDPKSTTDVLQRSQSDKRVKKLESTAGWPAVYGRLAGGLQPAGRRSAAGWPAVLLVPWPKHTPVGRTIRPFRGRGAVEGRTRETAAPDRGATKR